MATATIESAERAERTRSREAVIIADKGPSVIDTQKVLLMIVLAVGVLIVAALLSLMSDFAAKESAALTQTVP